MRVKIFFATVLYFLSFYSYAIPGENDFSITLISHQTNEVKKLEKVEIGVKIPSYLKLPILKAMKGQESNGALNPFLSWDIRVYATFKNIETGSIKIVEGFYYQDYKIAKDKSRWVWNDTPYPYRIRFAAPSEGDWEVQCYLKVKGQDVLTTSNTIALVSLPSAHKGYMRIADNKKNFELNGKIVVPIGVNLPWPNDINSWFPKKGGPDRVTPKEYEEYIASINLYHQNGGAYFRLFLTPSASDIEYEKVGHYFSRLDYAWAMDKVFETIEKNNMYVNFNMLMHTWMEIHAAYYMFRYDWETDDCFGVENGYKKKWNLETPDQVFTHPDALKYLKERYRYIIARWGYSPNIHTLELMSETGHLNEDRSVSFQNINGKDYCYRYTGEITKPYLTDSIIAKAQFNFNKVISEYIKDSLLHTEHILGVSYLGIDQPASEIAGKYDRTFDLQSIDAIGLNIYNNSIAKNERFVRHIDEMHKAHEKPIYFSESGPSDQTAGCDKNAGYEIDSWIPLFSGIAGYNIWSGESIREELSDYHGPVVWKFPIESNKFYNNEINLNRILGGDWSLSKYERKKWGRKVKSAIAYGYIASNKRESFGLIFNRTFNAHTQFDSTYSSKNCPEVFDACDCDNDPITQKEIYQYHKPNFLNYALDITDNHLGKYLKLKGLKAWSKYRITWYNNKGEPISDYQNLTSNIAGQIKLKHDAKLIVEGNNKTPFLLFKIEKL